MQTTLGSIPTVFSESSHSDDIHHIDINSSRQWLTFMRNLRNGLYVITHDHAIWHRSIGFTSPHIQCDLQVRIRRRLKQWSGSHCYLYHSSNGALWLTSTVPDHFCVECARRIKVPQKYCQSCLMKIRYWNSPFFESYEEIPAVVTTATLERGYRMISNLRKREKLALTHTDCTLPHKCPHVRLYVKNMGNRNLYESKIIKTVSYYVRSTVEWSP